MKKILLLSLLCSFLGTACSQQQKTLTNTNKENPSIENYIQGKNYENYEVATFAGGCFWCIEAAFSRINGVEDAISGYSGGEVEHPTYSQVGEGNTGHAESVMVYYDPEKIDFKTLLQVFFVAHDPRFPNREGNDVGTEYRSIVFYHNDAQKETAEAYIKELLDNGVFDKIATEVIPYTEFWVAEDYHQDYYEHHPENPYVRSVSRPKVEAVKKQFADILKPEFSN
ncbi:MAG: peptide-methionine (S)-S-oxide reductase MsrA [Saprospiraceae bacterium]|nr:peptide-methionine (S)-S-oxide reductase MsrA [Saprospiraceae bacterium]MCB9322529.1 peptide-methionine (S)-S-oxide reductase MsrA [Lewinellaceae bacterium]